MEHETDESTLIRNNELSRERGLEIIETPIPIPIQKVEQVLRKIGLKYEDII